MAAAPASASRTSSCRARPPTSTATEPARHRWPAAPNADPMIAGTAWARSASGITTSEFLAPPRAWQRFPVAADRSETWRAVVAWPTNEIASTSGWSSRPLTASRDPCRRLQTPAGISSIPSISSKISSDGRGSRSEGLSTKALPQAIANGRNHSGIIAGKLNGVIAATTPTGWRTRSTSTPAATPSSPSPFSRWGIAQAASVDSIPRSTSPRASSSVLPMSSVTSRAIRSRCAHRASRSAITARARRCGATARHSGWAARAADTAASTSAAPDSGTSAISSPLAGSMSSRHSSADARHSPPT